MADREMSGREWCGAGDCWLCGVGGVLDHCGWW